MMDWLIDKLKASGEQTAVIFKEKSYSYAQLAAQVEAYFAIASGRLQPGDIVAIISDYSFESIALFLALSRNRNIVVPITTKVESEIEDRIRVANCRWRIVIGGGGALDIRQEDSLAEVHPLVRQLVDRGRSGLILFSSGSTGRPKAMIHDLDNLIDSYRDKKGKRLVFLIFLMFDHIGGLNTLLNCLSMGVTMVFPENRDPEHVARLIEKYKVNILPASPTFLNLILISEAQTRFDLSSLRMITYGTEPMPESLLLKLKETFGKVKFLQTFGTSETGITQTSSKSSNSTFIRIDDPNTEYRIVDGELWIRSKTQIMGYLNSSMERFTEDGWFKTGDLVEEAEDGYIKIVGRNKELINVGGEKVLPSEVESVLFQMPDLQDCLVYGEPNPITGQMVTAKVLFREPLKTSEAKKRVVAFCQDKLERYKIPAKVILMTESEYSERFKKKRL
jgi:acyl-CoA synthetase (AMP-forming)/AMP-acid ligase II